MDVRQDLALYMGAESTDELLFKLQNDFVYFTKAIWHDRGLDIVAPPSDIELDMADFAANHSGRRRGILAFRGIGKTYEVTAGLTCFRLRRDLNRECLIVSKSKGEAGKTGFMIREWLDAVWFLQDLAPLRDQRDNLTQFDVNGTKAGRRQASVTIIGIEGQLEGNRGHTIIPDDIETKGNTKTQEARDTLVNLCTEFKNIVYPHRPYDQGGPIDPVEIVYVGTPKNEDTTYVKVIKKGYLFRAYPIAAPRPDEKVISLAPIIREKLDRGILRPGQPTCPLRFPRDEVLERQAEGYIEYARESMLIADLANSNRYPLKLSDVMVMDIDRDLGPLRVVYGRMDSKGSTAIPDSEIESQGFDGDRFHRPAFVSQDMAPFVGTKMWIDPAGKGQDRIAVGVVSYLAGMYFAKRVVGLEGGATQENYNKLALIARETNTREIGCESNWGGAEFFMGAFEPILRRHFCQPGEHPSYPDGWSATVIHDTKVTHSTGQKELRIIGTLEPVFTTRRMVFDRSVAGNEDLQKQLTRMMRTPKAMAHEDEADALAGAVKLWHYTITTDTEKAADRLLEQERIEAEKYVMDLFGHPMGGPDPRFGFPDD